MNQPAKPQQHPVSPTPGPSVPDKDRPDGVPNEATQEDAKGSPTSDRQDSETAGKQ